MTDIRVLIIEDNRLLREGLTSILKKEPDICFEFATKHQDAIRKSETFKPEIIILDLGLRQQKSVEGLKKLQSTFPETKFIIIDLLPINAEILNSINAGADGFILKDATLGEFVKTIHEVYEGRKVLPEEMTEALFAQIVATSLEDKEPSKILESVKMTNREREIIYHITEGLSNKEIAQKLNISIYTVKSHVHNILEKLNLHSRIQLTKYVNADMKSKHKK